MAPPRPRPKRPRAQRAQDAQPAAGAPAQAQPGVAGSAFPYTLTPPGVPDLLAPVLSQLFAARAPIAQGPVLPPGVPKPPRPRLRRPGASPQLTGARRRPQTGAQRPQLGVPAATSPFLFRAPVRVPGGLVGTGVA